LGTTEVVLSSGTMKFFELPLVHAMKFFFMLLLFYLFIVQLYEILNSSLIIMFSFSSAMEWLLGTICILSLRSWLIVRSLSTWFLMCTVFHSSPLGAEYGLLATTIIARVNL
jgi:hypothetical protein